MSFASYEFIFLFLPLTLLAFWLGQRYSIGFALWSLSVAAFFFYIAWDPRDIFVAGSSIAFNYSVAHRILARRSQARYWLTFAIVANLSVLVYYKYLNFLASQLETLSGSHVFHLNHTIILPLGVSFFTFTQIAYLVDCYVGKVRAEQHNARDFILFVTFFPHLIAGPILHHANIIPQFHSEFRRDWPNKISAGVVMFVIGLAKKVLIADHLALLANPTFDAAAKGIALNSYDAWLGVLAYTGQLYFDFSGYSDMAVGAALLVGIKIPFNFDSPYRSLSIIEFWRRWHISLSTFLRDYLYIPLGGGKRGALRRYLNVFVTMLLGGIWHGAGVNFIIWGFLHGLFIVVNHAWRDFLKPHTGGLADSYGFKALAYILTMGCVVLGWIFFRAADFGSAVAISHSLIDWSNQARALDRTVGPLLSDPWLVVFAAVIAVLPINSLAVYRRMTESPSTFAWSPAMLASGFFFVCCVAFISAESPFLYFQF